MDLNRVSLLWRSTTDPEVKVTPNGVKVATFSVATNKKYIDSQGVLQEKAQFTRCVEFWKKADTVENYLPKWSRVLVEWELQTRDYEARDGSKRYITEILLQDIILLETKRSWSSWNEFAQSDEEFFWKNAQTQKQNSSEQTPYRKTPKQKEEISIDDLPF